LKAMAKEPKDRFASAQEMAEAVEQWTPERERAKVASPAVKRASLKTKNGQERFGSWRYVIRFFFGPPTYYRDGSQGMFKSWRYIIGGTAAALALTFGLIISWYPAERRADSTAFPSQAERSEDPLVLKGHSEDASVRLALAARSEPPKVSPKPRPVWP